MQMYKVFFKDRVFLLSDDHSLLEKNSDSYLFSSEKKLHKLIRNFENDEKTEKVTVIHHDISVLFSCFSNAFVNITAAGGLVTKDKSFLAIKRFGLWDLPKGHVEPNEDIKTAAIREVEEECGISSPEIVKELEPTFHTYQLEEKKILKKTYWYKMTYEGHENLTPQKSEDILEAVWMDFSNKDNFKKNTYNTLKDLLNEIKEN